MATNKKKIMKLKIYYKEYMITKDKNITSAKQPAQR